VTRRDTTLLILILVLAGLALFIDLDIEHPEWFENLQRWRPEGARDIAIRYGLDLRGGLKVLLAADVSEDEDLDERAMDTARQIVERRVNGMGLTEPVVQNQGDRRIVVELPGIDDPGLAIETIRSTALLEFVDTGVIMYPGTLIHTSEGGAPPGEGAGVAAEPGEGTGLPFAEPVGPLYTEPLTTSNALTPTQETTSTVPAEPAVEPTVYQTVFTGAGLQQVWLTTDEYGQYSIAFELYDDARDVFAAFTSMHAPLQGQEPYYPLCIVLDNMVVSCPVINGPIPDGRGRISLGTATYDVAESLMVQLSYGALPIPLRVETTNRVGPTLGAISVEQSIRAGIVGLSVVLLFMLVYYRLPGLMAALALVAYALLNLALYKTVPVTLTLPGIAGFLLSAGMAVDANILVFERMKEELRAGRSLRLAVEAGFGRAWTSIRDSQFSTLIVCAVLYYFGGNFGASVVKGFAVTLAIGTLVNLFTAVVATRTLIRFMFRVAGEQLASRRWLLGV